MATNGSQDYHQETERPISPGTKCVAVYDFQGESANDLSFSEGEELMIIQPCSTLFWYVAENARGHKGLVPMTYLEVKRRPCPPSPPKPHTPPSRFLCSPAKHSTCPPNSVTQERSAPMHSSSAAALGHSLSNSTRNKTSFPPVLQLGPTLSQVTPNIPPTTPTHLSHTHSSPHPIPPISPQRQFTTTPPLSMSPQRPVFDRSPGMVSPPTIPSTSPALHNGGYQNQSSSSFLNPPREAAAPPLPPKSQLQPPPPPPATVASRSDHLHSHRATMAHKPLPVPVVPPKPSPSPPAGMVTMPGSNASAFTVAHKPLPVPVVAPKPLPSPLAGMVTLPGSDASPFTSPGISGRDGGSSPQILPSSSSYIPPDINSRPPMPLPHELAPPSLPTKPSHPPLRIRHPTTHTFLAESGWYTPTVENVLSEKLHSTLMAFKNLHSGIFVFQCREPPQVAYVGRSKAMRTDLMSLIHGLTEKSNASFSQVEEALRFHYPKASQWNLRAWEFPVAQICLEQAKLIVKLRCLRPYGLNSMLEWFSREEFDAFCEWYTQHRLGHAATSTTSKPFRNSTAPPPAPSKPHPGNSVVTFGNSTVFGNRLKGESFAN